MANRNYISKLDVIRVKIEEVNVDTIPLPMAFGRDVRNGGVISIDISNVVDLPRVGEEWFIERTTGRWRLKSPASAETTNNKKGRGKRAKKSSVWVGFTVREKKKALEYQTFVSFLAVKHDTDGNAVTPDKYVIELVPCNKNGDIIPKERPRHLNWTPGDPEIDTAGDLSLPDSNDRYYALFPGNTERPKKWYWKARVRASVNGYLAPWSEWSDPVKPTAMGYPDIPIPEIELRFKAKERKHHVNYQGVVTFRDVGWWDIPGYDEDDDVKEYQVQLEPIIPIYRLNGKSAHIKIDLPNGIETLPAQGNSYTASQFDVIYNGKVYRRLHPKKHPSKRRTVKDKDDDRNPWSSLGELLYDVDEVSGDIYVTEDFIWPNADIEPDDNLNPNQTDPDGGFVIKLRNPEYSVDNLSDPNDPDYPYDEDQYTDNATKESNPKTPYEEMFVVSRDQNGPNNTTLTGNNYHYNVSRSYWGFDGETDNDYHSKTAEVFVYYPEHRYRVGFGGIQQPQTIYWHARIRTVDRFNRKSYWGEWTLPTLPFTDDESLLDPPENVALDFDRIHKHQKNKWRAKVTWDEIQSVKSGGQKLPDRDEEKKAGRYNVHLAPGDGTTLVGPVTDGVSEQQVLTIAGVGTAANEIQQLVIPPASGGTFTLSWCGLISEEISYVSDYDNLATSILTALNGISGLNGNVTVTNIGSNTIEIEWVNDLEKTNVAQLVADTTDLILLSETFSVDADSDTLTFDNSSFANYTKVQVSTTDTLPSPLVAATNYWIAKQTSNTVKIATSLSNAQNSIFIDITTAGAGIHSIEATDSGTIDVLVDTTGVYSGYTLTFNNGDYDDDPSEAIIETTAFIPFDATNTMIEEALEGLTTIEPADVTVTGGIGGPFTIAFSGKYTGHNLPLMVATSNDVGLTTVISPSVDGGQSTMEVLAPYGPPKTANEMAGGHYFHVHAVDTGKFEIFKITDWVATNKDEIWTYVVEDASGNNTYNLELTPVVKPNSDPEVRTTIDLLWNDDAATVQGALETILGEGNVVVTRYDDLAPNYMYKIKFAGTLANTDVQKKWALDWNIVDNSAGAFDVDIYMAGDGQSLTDNINKSIADGWQVQHGGTYTYTAKRAQKGTSNYGAFYSLPGKDDLKLYYWPYFHRNISAKQDQDKDTRAKAVFDHTILRHWYYQGRVRYFDGYELRSDWSDWVPIEGASPFDDVAPPAPTIVEANVNDHGTEVYFEWEGPFDPNDIDSLYPDLDHYQVQLWEGVPGTPTAKLIKNIRYTNRDQVTFKVKKAKLKEIDRDYSVRVAAVDWSGNRSTWALRTHLVPENPPGVQGVRLTLRGDKNRYGRSVNTTLTWDEYKHSYFDVDHYEAHLSTAEVLGDVVSFTDNAGTASIVVDITHEQVLADWANYPAVDDDFEINIAGPDGDSFNEVFVVTGRAQLVPSPLRVEYTVNRTTIDGDPVPANEEQEFDSDTIYSEYFTTPDDTFTLTPLDALNTPAMLRKGNAYVLTLVSEPTTPSAQSPTVTSTDITWAEVNLDGGGNGIPVDIGTTELWMSVWVGIPDVDLAGGIVGSVNVDYGIGATQDRLMSQITILDSVDGISEIEAGTTAVYQSSIRPLLATATNRKVGIFVSQEYMGLTEATPGVNMFVENPTDDAFWVSIFSEGSENSYLPETIKEVSPGVVESPDTPWGWAVIAFNPLAQRIDYEPGDIALFNIDDQKRKVRNTDRDKNDWNRTIFKRQSTTKWQHARVAAVSKRFHNSRWSKWTPWADPSDNTPPPPPTSVRGDVDQNKLHVEWSPPYVANFGQVLDFRNCTAGMTFTISIETPTGPQITPEITYTATEGTDGPAIESALEGLSYVTGVTVSQPYTPSNIHVVVFDNEDVNDLMRVYETNHDPEEVVCSWYDPSNLAYINGTTDATPTDFEPAVNDDTAYYQVRVLDSGNGKIIPGMSDRYVHGLTKTFRLSKRNKRKADDNRKYRVQVRGMDPLGNHSAWVSTIVSASGTPTPQKPVAFIVYDEENPWVAAHWLSPEDDNDQIQGYIVQTQVAQRITTTEVVSGAETDINIRKVNNPDKFFPDASNKTPVTAYITTHNLDNDSNDGEDYYIYESFTFTDAAKRLLTISKTFDNTYPEGSSVYFFGPNSKTHLTKRIDDSYESGIELEDASWAGGEITYTTKVPHNLEPGDKIKVVRAVPSTYDKTSFAEVLSVSPDGYSFDINSSNPGNNYKHGGKVYSDDEPVNTNPSADIIQTAQLIRAKNEWFYRVRVRAIQKGHKTSGWSPWSVPVQADPYEAEDITTAPKVDPLSPYDVDHDIQRDQDREVVTWKYEKHNRRTMDVNQFEVRLLKWASDGGGHRDKWYQVSNITNPGTLSKAITGATWDDATDTVTLTFASDPADFYVGDLIDVSGVNPTSYNVEGAKITEINHIGFTIKYKLRPELVTTSTTYVSGGTVTLPTLDYVIDGIGHPVADPSWVVGNPIYVWGNGRLSPYDGKFIIRAVSGNTFTLASNEFEAIGGVTPPATAGAALISEVNGSYERGHSKSTRLTFTRKADQGDIFLALVRAHSRSGGVSDWQASGESAAGALPPGLSFPTTIADIEPASLKLRSKRGNRLIASWEFDDSLLGEVSHFNTRLYKNPSASHYVDKTISAITEAGTFDGETIFTLNNVSGITVGDIIVTSGLGDSGYNSAWTVQAIGASDVTVYSDTKPDTITDQVGTARIWKKSQAYVDETNAEYTKANKNVYNIRHRNTTTWQAFVQARGIYTDAFSPTHTLESRWEPFNDALADADSDLVVPVLDTNIYITSPTKQRVEWDYDGDDLSHVDFFKVTLTKTGGAHGGPASPLIRKVHSTEAVFDYHYKNGDTFSATVEPHGLDGAVGASDTDTLTPVTPANLAPTAVDLLLTDRGTQKVTWSWAGEDKDLSHFKVELYHGALQDTVFVKSQGPNVATFNEPADSSDAINWEARVYAVDIFGVTSSYASDTGTAMAAPTAPTGLSLINSINHIKLTWSPPTVTDSVVPKYEVRIFTRKANAASNSNPVKTLSTSDTVLSFFTKKYTTNYWFRIRATKLGLNSSWTDPVGPISPKRAKHKPTSIPDVDLDVIGGRLTNRAYLTDDHATDDFSIAIISDEGGGVSLANSIVEGTVTLSNTDSTGYQAWAGLVLRYKDIDEYLMAVFEHDTDASYDNVVNRLRLYKRWDDGGVDKITQLGSDYTSTNIAYGGTYTLRALLNGNDINLFLDKTINVQKLIEPNATGTWTISYRGDTTIALPDGTATAAQVQAALEAIETIGVGNIKVIRTGGAEPYTYYIRFIGGLGDEYQPLMYATKDATKTVSSYEPYTSYTSTAGSYATDTVTLTVGDHLMQVGDAITISDTDTDIDGAQIVTAITDTSISYYVGTGLTITDYTGTIVVNSISRDITATDAFNNTETKHGIIVATATNDTITWSPSDPALIDNGSTGTTGTGSRFDDFMVYEIDSTSSIPNNLYGTHVIQDDFDRPPNTTSLGSAVTGQNWSAELGTWGISNDGAGQDVIYGQNVLFPIYYGSITGSASNSRALSNNNWTYYDGDGSDIGGPDTHVNSNNVTPILTLVVDRPTQITIWCTTSAQMTTAGGGTQALWATIASQIDSESVTYGYTNRVSVAQDSWRNLSLARQLLINPRVEGEISTIKIWPAFKYSGSSDENFYIISTQVIAFANYAPDLASPTATMPSTSVLTRYPTNRKGRGKTGGTE